MLSIDTNILIRFIVNDDKIQSENILNYCNNQKIFITKTVLMESEWVLRFCYKIDKSEIFLFFQKLIGTSNLLIEDFFCVKRALDWYEKGFDFTDALHLSASSGSTTFLTFDRKFAKKAHKFRINPTVYLLA